MLPMMHLSMVRAGIHSVCSTSEIRPFLDIGTGRGDSDQPEMLAPEGWLGTRWFFNRLFDGEVDVLAAFAEMKRQIDEEAGSP